MKFKIAVLGATGYIGSPHRREIRDCSLDATIVSLCGRRLELLKAAAAEDGAKCFTDDWRKAIAQEGVNLVLVCTPDSLHHEAVMESAKRGLHVVCETPVGMNAAEASQMWAACRDSNVGHFVPLWTRYVDVFRQAREIYTSGQLGQIRAFVYRGANPRPVGMPFTWRFEKCVFPGLRDRIEGRPSVHPGLDDGYRIQLFTEAAARSARKRIWVELSDIEHELSRGHSNSAGSMR